MAIKLASRATVYDRYAVSRKFTAQETAINVVQGSISLLVSESEIAELKNGNKTMYSRLSSVEVNLKSITLAISSSEYKDINGILTAVTQARASITLNSQNILLKVSKDSIVSSINQSAEAVTINASKINFNGVVTANQNFKILSDGSMVAKNGSFTGAINATSGIFKGSITGSTITGSTITGSTVRAGGTSGYYTGKDIELKNGSIDFINKTSINAFIISSPEFVAVNGFGRSTENCISLFSRKGFVFSQAIKTDTSMSYGSTAYHISYDDNGRNIMHFMYGDIRVTGSLYINGTKIG